MIGSLTETGEYEVIGRHSTTAAGNNAHVRVRRIDQSRGHDDSDLELTRANRGEERMSMPLEADILRRLLVSKRLLTSHEGRLSSQSDATRSGPHHPDRA